jgi:hypothetical protein
MKVALYVEDGVTQVVLTPETDLEKQAVELLAQHPGKAQFFHGHFYECMGGWVKQGVNKDSLMIRVNNA